MADNQFGPDKELGPNIISECQIIDTDGNLLDDDSPVVPPSMEHSSLLQQVSEDSKINHLSPVKDESLVLPAVHSLNLKTFAA